MIKQIIVTIVIFLIMVGAGIGELLVVKDNFDNLRLSLEHAYTLAQEESLTETEYQKVWDEWKERRERIEYFLNHTDFAEMNFRMSECFAHVQNKDFKSAMAHLSVLIELARHIPHQIEPTPEHIL